MVILAILLGKGSPQQKAKELFSHFDDICDGYLKKTELEAMFVDYAGFIACVLPIIAVGETKDGLLELETI